jgi:hypothetical protein
MSTGGGIRVSRPNPPAISIDPIDETRPDYVDVRSGNITPQTKAEEVNQIDEVFEAFWILEGIS